MAAQVSLTALAGLPLFSRDGDLCGEILAAVARAGLALADGDILVVAQKVVSKVEGRIASLSQVTPSERANEIAAEADKDPRLVELILSEADTVMRVKRGVIVVRHRLGLVLANAGIDASNVDGTRDSVLLLPVDPDLSCKQLRAHIAEKTGKNVGVIINDSVGRAWRLGTVGLAIGAAGVPSLWDLRGHIDLFGRALRVSEEAVADELAGAASLLQGQGNEACPVVLIRGFAADAPTRDARSLLRPPSEDMFT